MNAEVYCAPVFYGLRDNAEFECTVDAVARNAIKLRERELDAAFLSPIDYGRECSDYHIIPNVAASSRVPGNTIVLHFKEGLHTIGTLAVNPASTSEIVLASILLAEQFDARPKLVPVMGPLDTMLRSADAALLVGNAALAEASVHRNSIDLVGEWNDMTGLPYVHGFWCVREAEFTHGDAVLLQRACETGVKSLDDIVLTEAAKQVRHSAGDLREYLTTFSFTFAQEEQDAVAEFLRYAYYHGILPDVADLHMYPPGGGDESPPLDLSLN
jgi:chorismate dehydratase